MKTIATFVVALVALAARPDTLLLENGVIHTVSGATYSNGGVLLDGAKIAQVFEGAPPSSVTAAKTIDLKGQHVYPGMIALDTCLGLAEIEAVRATQDTTEVGDYTPDVESWIAVNPDSELLPVARANGIAYFEPAPQGNIVSGQSGLVAIDGWTTEQMAVKKPAALHVFWPSFDLNLMPRRGGRRGGRGQAKSPEEQAKERRQKVQELSDFFAEAAAYAHAKDAAASNNAPAPEDIPAWQAMLPYVRAQLPMIVHADDLRQIKSAVAWATTNHYKICVAGARDAFRAPSLLATNQIPVIYEHLFDQPARDTDSYDANFAAPETLRKAGVHVIFGIGLANMDAENARNLPYVAAQAVAFGLPADEALKGLMLYPAQLMGVEDRLGSLEPGKEATLFICDGNILDIRSNVKQMWIAGHEVSLANRQTRLYDKYNNRPR